jgi:hypothetical protein
MVMNTISKNHPVGDFVFGFTRKLTIRGFLWSIALPVLALSLFYLVVGCTPRPHEGLSEAQIFFMLALFGLEILSLWIVPACLVACVFVREWRHQSVYLLTYAAAVALVRGAVFLAQPEFFNRFFFF